MSDSDSPSQKPRLRRPGIGRVIGTSMLDAGAFHLKRVAARLSLEGVVEGANEVAKEAEVEFEARLLLNDFSIQGASLFIPKRIEVGNHAKLVIQEPLPIEVHGRFTWLQEGKPSLHVLSSSAFCFRCGFEFCPPEGELAERIARFCQLVQASYPGSRKAS